MDFSKSPLAHFPLLPSERRNQAIKSTIRPFDNHGDSNSTLKGGFVVTLGMRSTEIDTRCIVRNNTSEQQIQSQAL